MTVFVEIAFLRAFEDIFDKDRSSHFLLDRLLTEYPDVEFIVDKDNYLDLIESETDPIPLLGKMIDMNPDIKVKDLTEYFENCSSLPFQSVILIKETIVDKEKLNELGAIVIDLTHLDDAIQNIERKGNFDIDLSEEGYRFSWNELEGLKDLPVTSITLSDNYLLNNSNQQQIDNNCSPLLISILPKKPFRIPLNIYTDFKKVLSSEGGLDLASRLEKVSIRLKEICSDHLVKIHLINRTLPISGIDLHDRFIYSDFYIVEANKGFNLIPHRQSDSVVRSKTIFDKFSYRRMNNHRKLLSKYNQKVENMETLEIKRYP